MANGENVRFNYVIRIKNEYQIRLNVSQRNEKV